MSLLESLGQGFQSAGEVLSPEVYEKNAIQRRDAMQNIGRGLQIQREKMALDADMKFGDAVSGIEPGMSSSAMLEAVKKVDPAIMAASPRAQQYMTMVSQVSAREAQAEARKEAITARYEAIQTQRDIAAERSEDRRLGAEERARHNLAMEKLQGQLTSIREEMARSKIPVPGATRDYAAEYSKLDDAGRTAMDMQAWNYINKNILPYRKGTGGGADRNDPIIHRAGQIANELGMDPQELSGKSAEFKANAQTLYAQTKKLNAVQGTLESFHNNIKTWESIAEGKAPELGGAKLAEMQDKLKKIDFSDVKTLNDWEIKLRTQFNDPAMIAYATAAMTVAMDYSRILSSQGQSAAAVTEGARNEALKLVAAGYNADARKALIGTLESDAAGQIKGLETQTNRLRSKMGLKAESSTADPKGDKKDDPLGIR